MPLKKDNRFAWARYVVSKETKAAIEREARRRLMNASEVARKLLSYGLKHAEEALS
jgi:hypothetical protein